MTVFTTPLSSAFEIQRIALEQGVEMLETGVETQPEITDALLNGVETQEDLQRRVFSLQHVIIHRLCDRAEEQIDGLDGTTDGIRDVVDEQYNQLYASHGDLFDTLIDELERSIDVYDDVSNEVVDAFDEQLELLIETTANLESQSLETAEQLEAQLETLSNQLPDVQEHVERSQDGSQ